MFSQFKQTVLSDLTVREAMRAQVINIPEHATIEAGIRFLIKYKINALLITDENELPIGVVSKTDIMAAYYGEIPLKSPLQHIMISPPLFCDPDDSLASALDKMRSNRVYRLYVLDADSGNAQGILAYPDIVGLLYQYCYTCDRSLQNRRAKNSPDSEIRRLLVKDVMTPSVTSYHEDSNLLEIMDGLIANRFGAVLIINGENVPIGVVSKTDLMMAYKRGISFESPAHSILSGYPVRSCDEASYIEEALRMMILSEVQRLFVHKGTPEHMVGVFSLSDAARLRSGSCHACVSARIRVEEGK
jgi:CBS domain-containing protein